MTPEEFAFVFGAVLALAALIWTADYADRRQASWARWVVRLTVWGAALLYVVQGVDALFAAYAEPPSADAPSVVAAQVGFALSVAIAVAVFALTFAAVRRRLVRIFPPFCPAADIPDPPVPTSPAPLFPQEGTPLFPQQLNYYTDRTVVMLGAAATPPVSSAVPVLTPTARGFNPASELHALALILIVLALGGQFMSFVLDSGLSGVAEEFKSNGLSISGLLINSLPLVVLPFVGVGLGTRRTWRQALRRLGLGRLGWNGVRVALGTAFILLFWMVSVGILWQLLTPQDLYEEQTQATDALARSVTTLGVAFTLAATAAVGEEITFRGALQPVFGFWPTALCFTLFHAQYAFTPAWLLIFGVAVALGWVRQRYNTTTAILTHFLYNFIQLLAALSLPAFF